MNDRPRHMSEPPRTNNYDSNQNAPPNYNRRPGAETTTPTNTREAQDIAASQGRNYDFWKMPNVFQDLGLYIQGSGGQTLSVCYVCRSPGHRASDCIAQKILMLNGQVQPHRGNGYQVTSRMRPVPEDRLAEVRRDWKEWLDGRNQLGYKFSTIGDLNRYFAQKHTPSLEERNRLAELYYGVRPTVRSDVRAKYKPQPFGEPQAPPVAAYAGPSYPGPDWNGPTLTRDFLNAKN